MVKQMIPNASVGDSPVCVVGQDIDRELAKKLEAGDRVLVEMNGARVYTNQPCPLVADEPWVVYRNNASVLELRHPGNDKVLFLPYATLLKNPVGQPAVWCIQEESFRPGPIYVILQFVAYRLAVEDIQSTFKPDFDVESFDEILEDPQARHAILRKITAKISKFSHPGWQYRSVCRFALRSNVRAKTIEAFRVSNWKVIEAQSVDTIKRIARELGWMKLLRQHSETVLLDESKEAPSEEKRLISRAE